MAAETEYGANVRRVLSNMGDIFSFSPNIVVTDGKDAPRDLASMLAHEVPHGVIYTGLGKTKAGKAFANVAGTDVPSGQSSTLPVDLVIFKEKWRRALCRKSGEVLAIACHEGLPRAGTYLKPLRYK